SFSGALAKACSAARTAVNRIGSALVRSGTLSESRSFGSTVGRSSPQVLPPSASWKAVKLALKIADRIFALAESFPANEIPKKFLLNRTLRSLTVALYRPGSRDDAKLPFGQRRSGP